MLHATSSRVRSLASALLLLLGCGACATADDADTLRDLPPAPLVVLVDWAADGRAPSLQLEGEPVAATRQQMAEYLAQELRALDASSRIVTRAEAANVTPDVTLTFEPNGEIAFSHIGASGFLAAGGLWLVTWIGGLLVPDSEYEVRIAGNCRFAVDTVNSFDEPVSSEPVELSFFERNDFLSGPTLQSLVLPPFWTTDQTDKTGDALARSAMRIAARRAATLLKTNFEDRAADGLTCAVRVEKPANGSAVSLSSMPIQLVATSHAEGVPVKRVAVSVNDGPETELSLQEADQVAFGYRLRGNLTGLAPGRENWVRIRVTTDQEFTRTLRLEGDR
jgi:hypothetical protein